MPAKKKTSKNRETDRDRNFRILLYPDNESHNLTIMSLKLYQYSSVGILHNQDVYHDDIFDKETGDLLHEKGELKKEHYHFYVKFKNPRYISGVASELGIEENLIQFADKPFKSYCEYILHWKESGKHQYLVDELVGSLAGEAKRILLDMPVTVQFCEIGDFISKYPSMLTFSTVYDFARQNGYLGAFLRNHAVVDKLIYCHNERFYRK